MAIWERIGLPFAPITKPHELFGDPHLNQSRNLLNITLPHGRGKAQVPGFPLTLDGLRTEIRHDLPVDAVFSKPVSGQISLLTGNLTGKSLNFGLFRTVFKDFILIYFTKTRSKGHFPVI